MAVGGKISFRYFFIGCIKILPFIKKMIIDEPRVHVLTNFEPVKTKGRSIETDHNTEILELGSSYQKKRQERKEIFYFKNQECQEVFFNITSETSDLTGCLKTISNFKCRHLNGIKPLMVFFIIYF